MPTTWAMYVGRLSLKGTWKGILEVSAFLVYYITILCSSTSQITRTSQQVWRVHLVYVASGITSSRQSQQADRPTFLPGDGPHWAVIFSRVSVLWYKTLTREKITAQWARLPVGRMVCPPADSGATSDDVIPLHPLAT